MDVIAQKYNAPGVDCIVYKNHEMVFRYFAGQYGKRKNRGRKDY